MFYSRKSIVCGTTGGRVLTISFWGVRGSTPCDSPSQQRYGGNTSCVVVETGGGERIIFDLGTGLRLYGESLDDPFVGTALVTHLHWDHVQGLPFFAPLNRAGARLDVYGPGHDGATLGECFGEFMRPPYFPIRCDELAGSLSFQDLSAGSFTVGDALVTACPVPHVGETNGYRIDCDGSSVAYISDHQEPIGSPTSVDDSVLELCADVDVLIHDAQYTPAELAERETWGHCTVAYAVEVARQAGARQLVLFHHDPSRDDEMIDALVAGARAEMTGGRVGRVDCLMAAHEGLTLTLG